MFTAIRECECPVRGVIEAFMGVAWRLQRERSMALAAVPRPSFHDDHDQSGIQRRSCEPIGQYVVSEPVAHGAMASEHLGIVAADPSRIYALKRLRSELARDESLARMVLDESAVAASVQHPNIVSTYGGESIEGATYLVMEHVRGITLRELIAQGPVPAPFAVAIIAGVLRGLHAAHEAVDSHGYLLDIVHRAVAPENIIVGVDGVSRIANFGLAPPETQNPRKTGRRVSRRVDIRAAAAVLWESLVGEGPEGDIEPPSTHNADVPGALDDVVMRALGHEFRSGLEMALALEDVLLACPVTPAYLGAWIAEVGAFQLANQDRIVRRLQGTPTTGVSMATPSLTFRSANAPPRAIVDVLLVTALVLVSAIAGALAMHLWS